MCSLNSKVCVAAKEQFISGKDNLRNVLLTPPTIGTGNLVTDEALRRRGKSSALRV